MLESFLSYFRDKKGKIGLFPLANCITFFIHCENRTGVG